MMTSEAHKNDNKNNMQHVHTNVCTMYDALSKQVHTYTHTCTHAQKHASFVETGDGLCPAILIDTQSEVRT